MSGGPETVCPWEEIPAFFSPGEVRRFLVWMEGRIAEGHAAECPARAGELDMGFRRFRHLPSGDVWELSPPDGPAAPAFRPVRRTARS